MPSKLIIASFSAGIVAGATVMGAIGLRNSSAQTAEQPGRGSWRFIKGLDRSRLGSIRTQELSNSA